jgi:hypothetical protein
MNLILTLLLLLLSFDSFGSMPNAISFQPYRFDKSGGSIVVVGDFADVRVLDTSRKQLAYWMVKKGPLKIEHFFKAMKLSMIKIDKTDGKFQFKIRYNVKDGRLKLIQAKRASLREMAGSLIEANGVKNICELHNDLLASLKSVSKDINIDACSQNLDESIIDPSCKTVFPPQEYKALRDAYIANLMIPEEENQVSTCLKRPETSKTLADAYKIAETSDLQTQIEIIDFKFKLDTLSFYNPAKPVTKKITCAFGNEMATKAITQANGITTYYRNKNAPESKNSNAFERLVMHELFHSSGVINESTTRDLVSICFDGAKKVTGNPSIDKADIADLKNDKGEGDHGITRSESTTLAQHQQADTTTATKITTDIALTAVPDTVPASDFAPAPAALAQTVIDSGSPAAAASPDYPATYARVAMQQGASAIRSAQSLLSAAGAAVLPLANASTNGLRAPAAVSKPSIYIPSSSVSASSASARAGNLAVASADSDFASGSDALPTGNAQKNLKAGRNAAGPEVGSRPANSTGSAPSTGSVGGTQGAGGFGASGSSSGTSASGGSYTPGQANQTKRSPASVDRKEQQSIMELLNKPTAYRIAKKKLDDKDFVRKLEKNGIVIFKNDGTYKGDPAAAIKYSDKGNRFVREDK